MLNTTIPLTGSSIMIFNPQIVWLRAFRERPKRDQLPTNPNSRTCQMNQLVHSDSLYLFEPDEVRKCLEKIAPQQIPRLVLLNE